MARATKTPKPRTRNTVPFYDGPLAEKSSYIDMTIEPVWGGDEATGGIKEIGERVTVQYRLDAWTTIPTRWGSESAEVVAMVRAAINDGVSVFGPLADMIDERGDGTVFDQSGFLAGKLRLVAGV